MGHTVSDETKAKMSQARMGHKHSEESKAKMSQAHIEFHAKKRQNIE
jgi:hypothetical protein